MHELYPQRRYFRVDLVIPSSFSKALTSLPKENRMLIILTWSGITLIKLSPVADCNKKPTEVDALKSQVAHMFEHCVNIDNIEGDTG